MKTDKTFTIVMALGVIFALSACATSEPSSGGEAAAVDITGWKCEGQWTNPNGSGSVKLRDFKVDDAGKLTGYAEFTNSPAPPDSFYGRLKGHVVQVDGPHGWMKLTVDGQRMHGTGADNTNRAVVNIDLSCEPRTESQ